MELTVDQKISALRSRIHHEKECLRIVAERLYIAGLSGQETKYIIADRDARENVIRSCEEELAKLEGGK